MKAFLLVLALSVSQLANATLISRLGGQVYYDTLQDITWLANANFAATNTFGVTEINPNGTMNWQAANNWIDAMNAAMYLGYDQWRLPTTAPVNGVEFVMNPATTDGSTDQGYNIGVPGSAYPDHTGSEIPHLYYITLENPAAWNIDGTVRNPCADTTCLLNSGPFANLQIENYWTGTEYSDLVALNFQFGNGAQNFPWKYEAEFSWAVATGDPFAVPIPTAAYLFGSALLGLLGLKRRQYKF